MSAPIFVRSLRMEEIAEINRAAESSNDRTARRARILLLSSDGKRSTEIASEVGCTTQTVRNVIHDFEEEGSESLHTDKPGPKDPDRIFDSKKRANLIHLLNYDPDDFSKDESEWTLELLAQVAHEVGLTERVVSHETIRQAILETGKTWMQVKKSSAPTTATYMFYKKVDGLIGPEALENKSDD